MKPPRTAGEVRALLQASGLWASRARGQNFLMDAKALDRIVDLAGVRREDLVLEVGAGLGCLTDRLAERAAAVVTVEVDRGLAALSGSILSKRQNVVLVTGDALSKKGGGGRPALSPLVERALEAARSGATGRFLVVSNLPYSAASPLLLAFLDRDAPPARAVVLVQKEFADRIVARAGSREHSLLGVCVRYFAAVTRDRDLGPAAFWPAPEVRSTILVLEPGRGFGGSRERYADFREVAGALFSGRRKCAATALARLSGKREAKEGIAAAGLPEEIRADSVPGEAILALVEWWRSPPNRS